MTDQYDFYVAGGMRGYPDLNYPLFNMISKRLRDMGFLIFNPAEHDGTQDNETFASCMHRDLNAVINSCKGIILLPKWEESLGANAEAFAAFVCGKKTMAIDNLSIYDDKADFDIVPIDLTDYCLPYMKNGGRQFDPHRCPPESFPD